MAFHHHEVLTAVSSVAIFINKETEIEIYSIISPKHKAGEKEQPFPNNSGTRSKGQISLVPHPLPAGRSPDLIILSSFSSSPHSLLDLLTSSM